MKILPVISKAPKRRLGSGARTALSGFLSSVPEGKRYVGLETVAREILRASPDTLYGSKTMIEVLSFVIGHIASRKPGTIKLRMEKTSGGRLVFILLQEDRPFIVRSLREFLVSLGVEIDALIHPLIRIDRDSAGRIRGAASASRKGRRESVVIAVLKPPRRGIAKKIRSGAAALMRDLELATGDFDGMRSLAASAREAILSNLGHGRRAADAREAAEFIDFLINGNLVFLGAERKTGGNRKRGGTERFGIIKGKGEDGETRRARSVIEIDKWSRETLLYSSGLPEEIRVTIPGGDSFRFVGFYTDRAERRFIPEIPLLRRKVEAVREGLRILPGSFNHKELLRNLGNYPLDTLLTSSADDLSREASLMLEIRTIRGTRSAFRYDPGRKALALTVIVPRNRYRPVYRRKIRERIEERLDVEYATCGVNDDPVGGATRLHYLFRTRRRPGRRILDSIEEEIRTMVTAWEDEVFRYLASDLGEEEASRISEIYLEAFNETYKVTTRPRWAAYDIEDMERLGMEGGSLFAWGTDQESAGVSFLKVYTVGNRLPLSTLAPIIGAHGLIMLDESAYPVTRKGAEPIHLHIFRIRTPAGGIVPHSRRPDLCDSLKAVFDGKIKGDRLNGLVLLSDLDWRKTDLLRMIHSFHRQTGGRYTRRFVNETLLSHPSAAELLFDLFETRLAPGIEERREREERIRGELARMTDAMTDLSEDRIMRRFTAIVGSAVRTNFFLADRPDTTAIKFDSSGIPGLPHPVPYREIFVSGPLIEGCHLRAGEVARGGIRWSERGDDFRTEILDLMKTQVTKNAMIVPTGAKGGFVLRHRPERGALGAAVREGYEAFIGALLDIQDSVERSRIRHPDGIVALDGEDPYLVVAADRGTARFSDLANSIAIERRYWLGDAFASGGSNGYDHKAEGITAKGAWEAARRHLREMGLDPSGRGVTVVGIGDMSGDVFGNGMILSKGIRLVAAFDHRHILVDPDPDPAGSYSERLRLFRRKSSSWMDYDKRILSPGGGVWERTAKRIRLSHRARKALGTDEKVVDGEGLIRIILKAPVDLLYNGGIGTYVKSSRESNADVGDSTNAGVRIDADELRARIVVEGGNLGLTQAARTEYAALGGRIQTDAFDNVGGVALSDAEVNLKILLDTLIASGRVSAKRRSDLLSRLKDEVVEMVLGDVRDQNLALSLDMARTGKGLEPFARLIADLESRGELAASEEGLPNEETVIERMRAGRGLLRPEIAKLIPYAKIDMQKRLIDSTFIRMRAVDGYLNDYFPPSISRYRRNFPGHLLRKEIIATYLANRVVNRYGSTALFRLTTELGLAASRVVEALLAAEIVMETDSLWQRVLTPSGLESGAEMDSLFFLADKAESTARWLVRNLGGLRRRPAARKAYEKALSGFMAVKDSIISGDEKALFAARTEEWKGRLRDNDLAASFAALDHFPTYLDCIHLSRSLRVSPILAGRTIYETGERIGIVWMMDKLRKAPAGTEWDRGASENLLYMVRQARRRIATAILKEGTDLDGYLSERKRSFETLMSTIRRIDSSDEIRLQMILVLAGQIRNLATI